MARMTDEAARLHDLFRRAWDAELEHSPETATYLGFPGHDHRWSDRSPEAIERNRTSDRGFLEELRSIDRSALDETDQTSYDVFDRLYGRRVSLQQFPTHVVPFTTLDGPHVDINRFLHMTRDEEARSARLAAVGDYIDQVIALLDEGRALGVTHHREAIRTVPDEVAGLVPTLGEPMARYERFLRETYLPSCRESVGWSNVPDGEAWYAELVGHHTTTTLSPKEIHEIGHEEVARIRAEMETARAEAGFEGDLIEFASFLRSDPQFFCTSADELLTRYREICKRIDPLLVDLFGTLPRLPYGVKEIPAHEAPGQTTAYYWPGSPTAPRPGWYMANTYDLPSRPIWEMDALTLHEAVPGHHLQIALAAEIEDLPEFRKHEYLTAYVEGWALYAESLGSDLDCYRDPYSRFGQLTYEMWRAVRLVVDTGMHALGWSRQQAIDFFTDNTAKTAHDIEVEVDRYISWPGQALAYKLGELKIKELRSRAETQLGAAFDVRGFHDVVLSAGPLPLDLLEDRVTAWMVS